MQKHVSCRAPGILFEAGRVAMDSGSVWQYWELPKCTRQGLNDPMIRALPPDTSGIYERTKKARWVDPVDSVTGSVLVGCWDYVDVARQEVPLLKRNLASRTSIRPNWIMMNHDSEEHMHCSLMTDMKKKKKKETDEKEEGDKQKKQEKEKEKN